MGNLSGLINLTNIYCALYGDKETSKTRVSSSEIGTAMANVLLSREQGQTPLVGLALKRCEFCLMQEDGRQGGTSSVDFEIKEENTDIKGWCYL